MLHYVILQFDAILVQRPAIDHFTVVCLVAWPLNESEAGVDLVLIEPSLLFICKLLLISMRTAPASLSFRGQATKQETGP